jgi:translation initiation factor IF-2
MRIYEFSKKNEKSNKDVISLLTKAGFDIKSHMSLLSDEAVRYLEKHFKLEGKQAKALEAINNKDINKKTNQESNSSMHDTESVKQEIPQENLIVDDKRFDKKISSKPVLLGDLADNMGVPASHLIIFLLKKGVVCNINQLLTKEQICKIAEQFEMGIEEPVKVAISADKKTLVKGNKNRLPVVVIIGHVDHGKTTLLDYIRHTRVVAKEKGGITQHLGAYRVESKGGSVVFLDTPGHEAFTAIRKRGLKVADIAILIVAADDGVMPQTVEAIRQAQEVGLPIIVAVNKIDKVGDAQVEKIKTQLSQYGLTPEEWGGETIMVKVSAKDGTNVDELIEMIALQSEIMELRTNLEIPACGYVLEAKKEKGRGSVATFIAQHGNLNAGDFFVCGDTSGKVVSLKSCSGLNIASVGPSIPVGISGFDDLPRAGDYLRVISEVEYRKIKSGSSNKSFIVSSQNEVAVGDAKVKIFVKSDTASSDEAVVGTIIKTAKKMEENVMVVGSDVGDINEGDISYADSIGALIYGFGVKITPSAAGMAKGVGVSVNLFDIIYKLSDHLEETIEKNKVKIIIKKKIGEVIVKKVFNIKGVGVIAGVYVKDGKIIKGCEGVIMRGGKEVGRGKIGSLQKARMPAKEISSGYEGAFIIDKFTNWEEEDVVECFVEE